MNKKRGVNMDNFIGKHGNHFDAYWIIHGTPQGLEQNSSRNDPGEFVSYANFHKGGDTHIEFPSKPGEKFIKEKLPSGAIAYTFIHTGIHQITSDREGSNYGAITVIMDDMDEKHSKNFEQELKKWFEKNILKKFTFDENNGSGWIKWNGNARGLFRGDYDKQLKDSLESILKPYLEAQKSANMTKTDKFNEGIQQLKQEIAKLEQKKRYIETQLAEKYAKLEKTTKNL